MHRKPALIFIFFTLLLDVLGFGLLIPVAPKLVQSMLHAGAGGTDAEASPYVGALQSTYYAMAFLCSPLLGALSDRFGRRPVILISLFGSGLDFFAQALAPSLAWFFVTRAINGMTGASFTVASAYVADATPPEKRAAGFGLIGAAFGIGFVIGPALGGVLGQVSLRLPFYVAGGLTVVNWCYGLFVLPESLPRKQHHALSLARANPVGALLHINRYPLVLGLAATSFLFNLAQFALHAVWVLYTGHRYGWNTRQAGISLMIVGIGASAVQGGLARRLIPRLGEPRALLISLVLGAGAYLGYGLATEGWMIYTIVCVASLGGLAGPALQSMVTKTVHADEQGQTQGALASLQSLAGVIGPLIGSSAFAYFISDRAPRAIPGAPFFAGTLLSLAGLFWAWRTLRLHAPDATPPKSPGTSPA